MLINEKNVLITGAAGFLGSHLCDFFISKNYKVIGIDNLLTGSLKNLSQLNSNINFDKYLDHPTFINAKNSRVKLLQDEELAEFQLEYLRTNLDCEKVLVIGQSLGGAAALLGSVAS